MTHRLNANKLDNAADDLAKGEWLERSAFPGSGRGIVICAGGVQMFTNAWVLVWLLRNVLKCTLGIEVWHLGPGEMSSGMHGMLENLGAKIVDASAMLSRYPARIADGWQLKPYALIMSDFQEVLMLDADNVPTVDPAFLFELPEFAGTGAVFWPDATDISETNPIWKELGLPAKRRISFETGQMLIDKIRHRQALITVLRLNEDAEHFYRLVYGDKDTFLAAWLVAGSQYVLIPKRPITDRHILYQRDFNGDILFQHRTNAKWRYYGEQVHSDGFVHEAACETALNELRRIWNGRIFEPPMRSPAAMRIERSIEGRMFVEARPGEEDCNIELLGYHQIGHGRDFNHETWYVTETATGSFVLRIMSRHQVRCELIRHDDDHWVEADTSHGGMSLTAASIATTCSAYRNVPIVADLCKAVLSGSGWTPEASEELRITFKALCKLDPQLASDIAEYAHGDPNMDDAVKEGLLSIATELKKMVQGISQNHQLRSDTNILLDRRFYIHPWSI